MCVCIFLGLFQKKIPWGGGGGGGGERRQAMYFSMGSWCGKFSNYMGHWCSTKSHYMGGWCFAVWKGKKEYYLPKKREKFLSNLAKKRAERGNGHFCLCQIVKTQMFQSFVCLFVLLLYVSSQQLWSWRDGQFT